ncbi:type III secretion protein R [Rhizobacter sp. SG703]|nr:type III secretion protein R [Rhizobacter sp. SG703]
MMHDVDPFNLILLFVAMAFVPVMVVTMTCFLKLAIVLSILRNALGVQQIPPNMAIYGLALMLTVYVMAPVGTEIAGTLEKSKVSTSDVKAFMPELRNAAEPLRHFLVRNSRPEQRDFFLTTARRQWPPQYAAGAAHDDFMIVVPAFLVSELTSGFEIGFLLFLPFIVIDLVVSNILMAMGMSMVSPVTLTLPLKLFLFVMIDGWSRLIHGIVQTYAT